MIARKINNNCEEVFDLLGRGLINVATFTYPKYEFSEVLVMKNIRMLGDERVI
jgi:hypothetical protein